MTGTLTLHIFHSSETYSLPMQGCWGPGLFCDSLSTRYRPWPGARTRLNTSRFSIYTHQVVSHLNAPPRLYRPTPFCCQCLGPKLRQNSRGRSCMSVRVELSSCGLTTRQIQRWRLMWLSPRNMAQVPRPLASGHPACQDCSRPFVDQAFPFAEEPSIDTKHLCFFSWS